MIYEFGDVELDTRLFELRRAGRPCAIEPQVFNVLVYLVEHADHVVTKDELLDELWPGRVVSESALTSRLKSARRLIGDTGREQRLIRTVHGRGYRFVGAVRCRDVDVRSAADPDAPVQGSASPVPVGRAAEVALLAKHFAAAESGALQVVFVEGEAGLGKTTLIEAFVDRVVAGGRARVGCGQCAAHGAADEAYLPVLDALDALCRGPGGEAVAACLEDAAPTWALQLPGLVDAERRAALEARILGVTTERMLREFAAAARALGAAAPLVLVLEDLHWSDPSTLAMLAWLGRRREPMRVLIVCSHRPGDTSESGRSLAETVYGLRLRGLARVIALAPLVPAEIGAWLEARFPGAEFAPDVVATLHARTEGNPLFLISIVDAWVDAGRLVETGAGWRLESTGPALFEVVPDNLRLVIEDQLNRFEPARRELLDAAAVVGARFPAALVETVTGRDCELCEDALSALADSRSFIARDGDVEWPDGTISSQFRFAHTLYRETVYAAVPARRRARMHAQVAERLEQALGPTADEHAVELARHWTAAGNADRAVHYRLAAAHQAFGRSGYREAFGHIERGLDLLARHPELPEHDARELSFLMLRAHACIQTNGWSDATADAALVRALALAEALDDGRLPSVLYVLAGVHELRGEYAEAQRLLERQHALPQPFATPVAKLASHELMACSTYHQGAFEAAVEHAGAGLAAADDAPDAESKLYLYGENPRVSCYNWAGLASWFLGRPDEARRQVALGLELARRPERMYTYSLSNALCHAATLHQLAREPERVLEIAGEAVDVALEEGFKYPLAVGRILKGWALAVTGCVDDGLALIGAGLADHHASGANMDRPYYLGLLAEAHAAAGQWDTARATLDDALGYLHGARRFFHEAELYRLRAELALHPGGEDRAHAKALLERSRDAAVSQGNRVGLLRAEIELVRLTRGTRSQAEYLNALRETCAGFDASAEMHDLLEARALLAREGPDPVGV